MDTSLRDILHQTHGFLWSSSTSCCVLTVSMIALMTISFAVPTTWCGLVFWLQPFCAVFSSRCLSRFLCHPCLLNDSACSTIQPPDWPGIDCTTETQATCLGDTDWCGISGTRQPRLRNQAFAMKGQTTRSQGECHEETCTKETKTFF